MIELIQVGAPEDDVISAATGDTSAIGRGLEIVVVLDADQNRKVR
jgi:hypothetical protein